MPLDDLTTAQAAAVLGVTPARVRQYIADGRLPARALTPRLHLVRAADVAKLVRRKPGRPKSSDSKNGLSE